VSELIADKASADLQWSTVCISRGIVGDLQEQLVVASPLYKQHFSLKDGTCLEEDISVPVYAVRIDGKAVQIGS